MEDEAYRNLLAAAISYVSYKMRTESDIRKYLRKKLTRLAPGEDGQIDAVIVRLTELGYINDAAYAASWVAERMRNKPRGKLALTRELANKGIDRDVIESATREVGTPEDQKDAARRILERKLVSWRNLSSMERRKKAYNLLMRRGFDVSSMSGLIDELVVRHYNT